MDGNRKHADLILKRGTVITMDPERRILENASVAVEGTRIAAVGPAEDIEATTLGGARALGREDLGRIAVGARADMIVLDLDGLDVGTIDDPLRTIVNSGTSREVRHSIIDGRFVMRDRVIPGIDEAALRDQAQAYYEKMRMGYWERSDGSLSPAELFPGSFPEAGRDR